MCTTKTRAVIDEARYSTASRRSSDASAGTAARCATVAPTPRSASESAGTMPAPKRESSCSRTAARQWKFSRTPAMGAACEESSGAVATEKRAVRVAGTTEKDTTGTWARSPMRATNSASAAVRDPSIMGYALAFLIRSTAALQATGQSWSSQSYRVSDRCQRLP